MLSIKVIFKIQTDLCIKLYFLSTGIILGKEALCTITLSDILAVERLQQESFNKNNMFQIIQPERVLYVQANNCVEEKEWVDLLTKMCFSNSKRLTLYHPAAFINGTWLW